MSLFDKLKELWGGKAPREPVANAERAPYQAKRRTTRGEDERIEALARTLFDAGRAEDALELLCRQIVLCEHAESPGGLPCLCRDCVQPELSEAEAQGERFFRDFVITKHRVFFFWAPAELETDRRQLRASMRAAVRERLRALARGEHRPFEGVNPFTKEPLLAESKEEQKRRAIVNPLTGKRLS